jgi:hypothetical protein
MIAVVVAAAAAASAVSSEILLVWGQCDCRSLELIAKLIATKKLRRKIWMFC